MYFLMALIVAFVSLSVPAMVGSLIHRQSLGVRSLITAISTVAYTLLLWLIFWAVQVGFYGPAPFFFWIILGAIVAAIIATYSAYEDYENYEWKGSIPGIVVIVGCFLFLIIVWIGQSDAAMAKQKAKLIGEVQTVSNLSELIQPADNKHICQVSIEIAKTNAQNALSKLKLKDGAVPGSRYVIGEPVKQFVDGSYWWIFPLEFDGYFKWNQDPQVPGYLRVSAENPSEEPQAVQVDKNGDEIHVKYLGSASFGNKAERYLRTHGYLTSILRDWTYEVDDNWRPYYTVTVVERTMGFTSEITKGIILFDVQTGETTFYAVDKVPSWVDRVIPLEIIDNNAIKWGKYSIEGWWYNVWHNDKSQKPTPGWFLVYENGECQWFSGFTSMNDQDQALTGFILTDARTGKSSFFKVSGVTEELAYDAAKALWNNYSGYTPTELVPYNIYGLLTYVIPMECNDQFSGISLVSLNNINIKAKGVTLEEALQSYRTVISQSDNVGLIPGAVKPDEVKLTGVVERISSATLTTNSQTISFKLIGVGKVFQVAYSDTEPKPLILKEGDIVVITYLETTEIVVQVSSFDIPSVVLETGSVAQAEKIKQEENTSEEAKRIEDQQKVDDLINSDAMKKVNPEDLQKFLEDQQKNK